MTMQTSMVVDRGKAGAGQIAETFQQLPPLIRIRLRRRSRAERAADAFQDLPTAARVGLVAVAAGVAIGVAYVARMRLLAADGPGDAAGKRSDSPDAA
jgi:hypothetical protein